MVESCYQRLGSALRERRTIMGFTQETIANQLGISRTSLVNIEAGRQRIALHDVFAFSSALQIAPEKILQASNPEFQLELPKIDTLSLQQEARNLEGIINYMERTNARQFEPSFVVTCIALVKDRLAADFPPLQTTNEKCDK